MSAPPIIPMIIIAEPIFVNFPSSFRHKGQSAGHTNAFESPKSATKNIEFGNKGKFTPIFPNQPKKKPNKEVLVGLEKIAPKENKTPVMAEILKAIV